MLLIAFVFAYAETFLGPSPIDSYIAKESLVAKAGVLANIGPDGSKSSGALVRLPPRYHFLSPSNLPIVRSRHRQPQHRRPKLPLHLDPRCLPHFKSDHPESCQRRRPLSAPEDRPIFLFTKAHSADHQSQRHRVYRRLRRTKVQNQRDRLHRRLG